jgi:adenylylsulfate kinase-like enzyme
MSVLILTSPAGAGKNTIAKVWSARRERCAIIDVDTVRQMLVQPHKAPWEGEEGRAQQRLGVQNACALARNFAESGADVVILDVLSQETLTDYREALADLNPKIVLLLPTWEEVQRRNKMRTQYLTDGEIEMIYQSQVSLTGPDQKIDNTDLSPEEVASQIDEMKIKD